MATAKPSETLKRRLWQRLLCFQKAQTTMSKFQAQFMVKRLTVMVSALAFVSAGAHESNVATALSDVEIKGH